jgi:hypothetical protein
MKLKKILASVAAFAMVATAFSSVVMANSYGSPELTATVDYPVVDGEDTYLTVTVGYSGFEGFVAYNKLKKVGIGLTSAGVNISYDAEKLDYVATMDGDTFQDGITGDSNPGIAYAWTIDTQKNVPSDAEFMVAYFTVKDGVDFSTDSVTFEFTDYEFVVGNKATGESEGYGTSNKCTALMTAEPVTYGATTPATEYVNVTTDGNVEGVADGQVEKGSKIAVSAKEVSGKTAKLYANGEEIVSGAEYTFDADVSFTVVYEDEVVTPEYTYSVTDYGKSESLKAIFYALSIVNPDTAMTLGVAGKAFTASGLPEVDGGASVDMTYVIKGVPENILTNVPEAESLTGATNGEYTLK